MIPDIFSKSSSLFEVANIAIIFNEIVHKTTYNKF